MLSVQPTPASRGLLENLDIPGGWREIVARAAAAADARTAPLAALADVAAVRERVAALDPELERALVDALTVLTGELLASATLLGFGLARTWPDGPDGLEAWPDRAIALAGIEPAAPAAVPATEPAMAWLRGVAA